MMKKLILLITTVWLLYISIFNSSSMAQLTIQVNLSPPKPIVFAAPPEMIVIPDTYVYVAPDLQEDIFFYGGSWWRPLKGHWYRSNSYNGNWSYYKFTPYFYKQIPPGWRNEYRGHHWQGNPWNYQRIAAKQVQQNWLKWEKDKHWEKQQTWGVQGLKPKVKSQQPTKMEKPGKGPKKK